MRIWFSVSVYCPAREHFVAVFDVITARKEAEQALREQGELLEAMSGMAHIGAWSIDVATGLGKWTDEVARSTSWTPSWSPTSKWA